MKIQNSNQGLSKNSRQSPSVKTNQSNDQNAQNFEKNLTKNSDQKGQDTSQDQNLSSLFSESKDLQPPVSKTLNAGKPIESEKPSSEKEQNFVQRLKQQGIEYLQKRGNEKYQQGHYVAAGIDAIGEFLISDIPETLSGAALGITTDLAMGKAIKLFGKGAKKLVQNIDKFSEPLQDKIKTVFKKVEADETITKADNATISKAIEDLDGKTLENGGGFDKLGVIKRNRVDDVGPKKTETKAFKARTNSEGLTTRAEGRITGPHPKRKKGYRPEPAGGRLEGHHRGHLVPENMVDDPKIVNVKENIISEAPGSNLGPKRVFENLAGKIAKDNPDSVVETVHFPKYKSGSTVPHAVTHYIKVDGKIVHGVSIPNK